MKLFKTREINEQEIAIRFVCGLSDEELKDFRKAVDFYRMGDKKQAEYYAKGNAVLAGQKDELDELIEEVEE